MWNALGSADFKQATRILTMPDGREFALVFGFESHSRALYVREVYEQMFQIVLSGGAGTWTITGPPGIGKSVFLQYILWRLRTDLTFTGKIIYSQKEHNSNDQTIFVFYSTSADGSPNLRAEAFERFTGDPRRLIEEEGNWWLMDGQFHGPWSETTTRATVVWSASTRKTLEDHRVMKFYSHRVLHMPLWDASEEDDGDGLPLEIKGCRDAFPRLKMQDEMLRARVSVIGSVPRYLFNTALSIDHLRDLVSDALRRKSASEIMVAVMNGAADDVPHRLVLRRSKFLGESRPFGQGDLQWASPFAMEQVIERLAVDRSSTLQEYLRLRQTPNLRGAAGLLFQFLTLPVLQRGGKFAWRLLSGVGEETLHWSTVEIPRLHETRVYELPSDLAAFSRGSHPVLFDTKPGQPTFDKILVFSKANILHYYFLQESLGADHSFKGKAIVDALAALPSDARAHYVRVSDPYVDRMLDSERRVTAVASVSSQDPLYYWYEENIRLLNGTGADADEFASKRQKKIQDLQKEPTATAADADASKKRKRDAESIAAILTGKAVLEQLSAKLRSSSLSLSHEEMQVDVASSSWSASMSDWFSNVVSLTTASLHNNGFT